MINVSATWQLNGQLITTLNQVETEDQVADLLVCFQSCYKFVSADVRFA